MSTLRAVTVLMPVRREANEPRDVALVAATNSPRRLTPEAAMLLAVRESIAQRRCLLCWKRGKEHRLFRDGEGLIRVVGSRPRLHEYDPGDRRLVRR